MIFGKPLPTAKELFEAQQAEYRQRVSRAEALRKALIVEARCGNCKFWRETESAFVGIEESAGARFCCINPPVVNPGAGSRSASAGRWPITKPNQWCGHWQPVAELLNQEANDEETKK